jgi:hypothetical protein
MHVLNRTLDALQEEVVAARAPSTVPLILFVLSVLLPLAAGVWLLARAERSAIGTDETIRTLLQCGLAEPVIRQYLPQQTRPVLPGPDSYAPRPPVQQRARRRRRRRRRGRAACRSAQDVDPPAPSTPTGDSPMLKLNAGLSRKVGEPDYGSRGASVNLELEV